MVQLIYCDVVAPTSSSESSPSTGITSMIIGNAVEDGTVAARVATLVDADGDVTTPLKRNKRTLILLGLGLLGAAVFRGNKFGLKRTAPADAHDYSNSLS
jgi:hypothetical protein